MNNQENTNVKEEVIYAQFFTMKQMPNEDRAVTKTQSEKAEVLIIHSFIHFWEHLIEWRAIGGRQRINV